MMKRVSSLIATLLIAVQFSTYAADSAIDRTWSSLFTTTPGLGGEVDGAGANWWVEIFNTTDNATTAGGTSETLGWFSGFGYVVDEFQFSATETDSVFMRLYNNTNPLAATLRIDSAIQTLPNLDNLTAPAPENLKVTFNFGSSTWQAVPEPATFMLFGMGGFGAWLIRRKNRKSE